MEPEIRVSDKRREDMNEQLDNLKLDMMEHDETTMTSGLLGLSHHT